MLLKSLSIQGFKSFDEEQNLTFDGRSGLYFLTGENQTNEQLGANGSGKTSVLDALSWVFFDKTSRALKASSIKNWNGKNKVKVSVTLTGLSNKEFTLTRTWNPNSLKWDMSGELVVVTQAELEQEIGFTFDTFHQCVLIPQFAEMFFDMKPSKQAQVFSDILDLDEWDSYADNAKKSASWFSGLMHDTEADMNTTEGQLIEIKNADTQKRSDGWEESRDQRIKDAKIPLRSLRSDLKAAEDDLGKVELDDSFASKIAEIESDLASIDDDIEDLNTEISDTRDKSVDSDISDIEAEMRLIKKQIAKVGKLKGTCSECNQEIDEVHKQQQIDDLEAQEDKFAADLDKLKDKQASIDASVKELRSKVSELKDEKEEIRDELDDIKDEKSKALRKHDSAEQKVKTVKRDLRRAESRVKEIEDEENPFTSVLKSNKEKLELLEKEKNRYEEEYASLCKQKTKSDFWVKNFKSIKLFIVSEVLTQLEVEVNNSLATLGMDGWEIVFDIARETGSGTIRKEFNTLIRSPHNDKLVPWQSWSGGESQRLRIAGTAGISNLLLARKGINCNVEFWDEPTNGMNQEGVSDLLNTLKDHALNSNKQVWLIDHRSLSHGAFEKIVTVVKDEDGSWIDEEVPDA